MHKPLVSIITPCYNCSQFVSYYIAKMLNQTYPNIQLIFIDDGSTDDTENILMDLKDKIEQHGFQFTYKHQKNRGVGGAVNTGLKLVEGDFFAWCDSDNYYSDDFVEKCVSVFQNNTSCNIVQYDGAFVGENDGKIISKFSDKFTQKPSGKIFENVILEKNFQVGCAMLRTAEFDRIIPKREIFESRQGQNWPILLPVLYENECYYIDEVLFFCCVRTDSVSNEPRKRGLQSVLEQEAEYKRILYAVLPEIDMPRNKLEQYLNQVDIKYYHRALSLAHAFNDKKLLSEQYKLLKQKNAITIKDRSLYIRTMLPLLNKCTLLCGGLLRKHHLK